MNKLFFTARECLGLKLSPTFKELGCVESLRTVFFKATKEELVNSYSTKTLYLSLKKDIRFEEVLIAEIGCLILSPTGTGNSSMIGHAGIVGENEEIYSNNSDTLLWDKKYTINSWHERYMRKGGFPVLYFRYIDKEPVQPEKPLETQILTNNSTIIEQLKVVLEKIASVLRELLNMIK